MEAENRVLGNSRRDLANSWQRFGRVKLAQLELIFPRNLEKGFIKAPIISLPAHETNINL